MSTLPAQHAANRPAPISLEFDDIILDLQRFGGISEYWREVTSRVSAMPDFDVRHRSGTRWGRMRVLPSMARVFHSSYFRTARGRGLRNISTVHDLAYEFGHVGSGMVGALHRLEHRRAYFASDALICVSANTRNDLLAVYPSLASRCQLFVIPHGVSMQAHPTGAPATPADRPYVLFVGGRGAYKNFGAGLVAYANSALSRDGCQLLCTGSPFSPSETRQIQRLGLTQQVAALGAVDRAQLAQLYRGAYCLLYPSLFEGFGMPLLEAMQLGCPVVASNASVMPEICGDAALLVDGRDPQALADAMQRLQDPDLRNQLVARGHARAVRYSWEASASAHADAYRSLAA